MIAKRLFALRSSSRQACVARSVVVSEDREAGFSTMFHRGKHRNIQLLVVE